MATLIEKYQNVSQRVNDLNEKINYAEEKIENLSDGFIGDVPIRIKKIEEQLVKIDEYLLKIKSFQELAKKNLDSQNVLTIEAPPGYRVNLNRLRNWAMMIDPTSANDPYAQRVYVAAKCDEYFLDKKKNEFLDRIHQLKTDVENGTNDEIMSLRSSIAAYREDIRHYVCGEETQEFLSEVLKENTKYWNKVSPALFINNDRMMSTISFGAYVAPFSVEAEQRESMKAALGEFYDVKGGRILLPVEIDNTREYVLSIGCTPTKRKHLDRGLQNFVLNTIHAAPAGSRKVYILDAVRFNTASMSGLRDLEGTFAMEQIPRNPEQLTATLEQIVASFSDIDEVLELHDSVAEYNASVEPGKQLPVSTVILFGWPHSFEGRDKELLQRIITNYERYGISLLIVSYCSTEKKEDSSRGMPEYALQNAIRISVTNSISTISFPGGNAQGFAWYTFNDTLNADYIASVEKYKIEKKQVSNDYTKLYSLTDIPAYVRSYKPIELPFGIDCRGIVHNVSFENENFAAYLVGASRSGKSTLLHTLITGLIRNYHPDNLELWLADFKQLEFKKYIEHCPAHVKYVLLDESPELVYDLIDKLTEKMLERQRLFAQLGKERIDQIDTSLLKEPLPVIFVILDEFSIMSQSIAESESYRIRLQNLLAKGAALGIRFLFSSQTFTTGIAGLTPTARAQIQQRISMKGTKDEINETLELSANIRTEQVVNWMEALPPHYALIKHRINADMLPVVNRVLVLYIPENTKRDRMIDLINGGLKKHTDYLPDDINAYTDKRPVIVDGNTYESFKDREVDLIGWMEQSPRQGEYTGDEVFLNLGTPRRMEALLPIVLAPESRENLLFLSSASEMPCSAAIIMSAIESFRLQGGNIHIWAYGRNRLYRMFHHVWETFDSAVDIDLVCDEIRTVKKKINSQEEGRDLFILLGMERICNDFEIVSTRGKGNPKSNESFNISSLLASGALVEQEKGADDLVAFLNSVSNSNSVQSISSDDTPQFIGSDESANEGMDNEENIQGAYNATDDFHFILSQGSRLGYHFLIASNSLADFKLTKAKTDLFSHRLSFQLSKDDSWEVFGNGTAVGMPEHICRYSDMMNSYSFRPYLHKEFCWDGWMVNDLGKAENKFRKDDYNGK